MKSLSLFLGTLFLSLVFPQPSEAQFSLKPRPLPDAKTFLLTEIGYVYRVSSLPEALNYYTYGSEHRHYFTSNLGFMVNLSPKYALGAANFFGLDTAGDGRWGAKVRLRRWFGTGNSADLSLGLNFADSRYDYHKPGFAGELSLNLHDLLMFDVLAEVYTYRTYIYSYYPPYEVSYRKGTDVGIFAGIKTGSTPGLIGNLTVGGVFAVLLLIVAISGGWD